MKPKTTLSLIAVIIIALWGCTQNQPDSNIEAGYYIFKRSQWFTTDENAVHPKIEFKSGLLHVIDNDSMEFVGENTIGEFFWEHSTFNYKIKGSKIILTHGDFKKKLNFEVTADHYLKFETNKDDLINIYFEPLSVKLSGKYKVFSFEKNEHASDSETLTIAKNVFNKESFNFISDKNVIIQPRLAQIIMGSTIESDTIFNYEVIDYEITFSNSTTSAKVPYIYDGAFRFFIDNENFERIDISQIKG